MPELPEVEITKNILAPHITGKVIEKVIIYAPKLRWPIPPEIATELPGLSIKMLERRAKYLAFYTAKGTLIIHLGMSGSLQLAAPESSPGKHDHFEIILKSGPTVRLNDPRKFGCVLWTTERLGQHKLFKNLGCEPLEPEFSPTFLYKIIQGKRQGIKQFIMEQKNVVGVGNIYASESLFLAKIHPFLPAKNLTFQQCKTLVKTIKIVLKKAILAGGTSIKDFVSPTGSAGIFADQLFVYGRKGQPCKICRATIQSQTIAQRNTFFCLGCQPI